LGGKLTAPSLDDQPREGGDDSYQIRRKKMHGLAQTRQSVQTLNRLLVGSLIQTGVNAVAISPCFGIPKMQAHGGDGTVKAHLETVLRDALTSGLVPVLHGDACLYGERNAGILSGDVLMEALGLFPWVSHVVFLTDVDGVFSTDPRRDPGAKLLPEIEIDRRTLKVITPILNVSGSTHEHDVTGGFEVGVLRVFQFN
jgi:isopentenyl phosphate kinase